ncbi:MAG: hypothetical protein KH454_00420 [Eggerthella sp.]|nr:hypothetical protein [Eggerthella sp.]MBS6247694.1 hypothetical protein [Eggerthella sp.]
MVFSGMHTQSAAIRAQHWAQGSNDVCAIMSEHLAQCSESDRAVMSEHLAQGSTCILCTPPLYFHYR